SVKGALARCMAPGYIVAARLPPLGTPATSPKVMGVINNWTGFVLVRHELQEQPAPGAGGATASAPPAAAPLVLYSLYMHLAPPNYERLGMEEYVKSGPCDSSTRLVRARRRTDSSWRTSPARDSCTGKSLLRPRGLPATWESFSTFFPRGCLESCRALSSTTASPSPRRTISGRSRIC